MTAEIELADQVVAGKPGAAEEFVKRYEKPVGDYLKSKCDTGLDSEVASEILNELLADCCNGFLGKFEGKGSLEGWLRAVAYNRLRKHWRKEGRMPTVSGDGSDGSSPLDNMPQTGGGGWAEQDGEQTAETVEEFFQTLMETTVSAFERLRKEAPAKLAVLRLSVLHKVKQKDIARVFGTDEPAIAKMKSDGIFFLQCEVKDNLFRKFPHGAFTFDDIREFAAKADEIVHDQDMAGAVLAIMGL